jgi:hypothetical protein
MITTDNYVDSIDNYDHDDDNHHHHYDDDGNDHDDY